VNISPDRGNGKTGSWSEKATTAGFRHCREGLADGLHLAGTRVAVRERHQERKGRGAGFALRARERSLVGTDDVVGQLAGGGAGDDPADRQVWVALGEIAPGHEALAHPPGEQPGVQDHESAHEVGVLDRPPQADRAAPVLHDHGEVRELDPIEVGADRGDVPLVAVPGPGGGLVGAAEADEVGADDAVAARH